MAATKANKQSLFAFVAENGSAPLMLKKMGCLLQVNKGSLKNKFGDNAYAVSQALIIREVADFVARRAAIAVTAVSGEIMTDEERRFFYSILDTIYQNLTKIGTEGIPTEE